MVHHEGRKEVTHLLNGTACCLDGLLCQLCTFIIAQRSPPFSFLWWIKSEIKDPA